MTRACAQTTGPRIRISRHDGASARCSVSNRRDPPSVSCPFTPPSTTHSTSSAISPPAARFASSETKRSGRGEPPPRPEHELGLPNCAGPNSVHVTAPLAVQAVHRIRSRLVADRVRLVNQVRGLLGEHGIVVAKDIGNLRRALARIAGEDEDRALNPLVRSLMRELREELAELDARIAGYDRKIRELYRNSEICQRLGKVEGIGPVTATALVAAVGDRSSFKNGRQFAAWLGLVPKQRSSGGRARLFGISKRGDRYLRTLLIHGARAALGRVRDKQDPRSLWLGKMRLRYGSGDTPTSSPSRSPTRMRGLPGTCSLATAFMTRVLRLV